MHQDNRFWAILTSNVNADTVRAATVRLGHLGHRRIQLFEFLVTETLANLCPEFTWTVTGVSGDGGIDLRGEGSRHSYKIGPIPLTMTYVIIGQVKRSAGYDRGTASDIIDRIILDRVPDDASKPEKALSHLLVVISGRNDKVANDYRQQLLKKSDRHMPGIPVALIDAAEFVSLWSEDVQGIAHTIGSGLPPAELAFVIDYLTARRHAADERGWTVVVSALIGSRVRGAVIELRVTIKAPNDLPKRHIALAWRPGRDITAVRPLAAVDSPDSPGCVRAVVDESGTVELRLRFFSTTDGEVSVGRLDVVEGGGWRSGSDGVPPALPLGNVYISKEPLDFGDVPYVRDPQRNQLQQIEMALKRAAAGQIQIIALSGGAGIGKSRLVEHIADSLHVEAGERGTDRARLSFTEPITIAHETELNGSRRFLRDVVLSVAGMRVNAQGLPQREDGAKLDAWLNAWLKRHTEGAVAQIDDAIAMLMSDLYTENAWFGIAFLMTICVLARSSNGPVFLHLANLHWADSFEVRVLEEFLHRLRDPESVAPNGIVIVLEGRTGEMSSEHGTATTDRWRALYESITQNKIELPPWDDAESERFLKLVLQPVIASATIENGLDARTDDRRWQHLRRHVRDVAAGNPMQMIEHLRMLRADQVLVDDGNGRLVVAGDVDALATAKSSLPQLVALRVRYLQHQPENRALIALLQVFAEIGMVVERRTFDAVTAALKDSMDVWRLRSFHVALVPADGHRDFRFIHETYRNVFRGLGWSGGDDSDALRNAALRDLTPADGARLDHVIAWVRLTRLGAPFDRMTVRDTLLRALDAAELEHDRSATVRLCDELLVLPEVAFEAGPRSRDALRMLRARALAGSGDWDEASRELEGLAEDLERRSFGFDADVFRAEVAVDRGNLLGDLMQCAEGIRVVHDGMRLLRRAATHRIDERLIRCREEASNRLGVLHWFSGRPDVGIKWQWQALRSARRNDPGGLRESLFLCEVGSALLHRYPARGRTLLERATALLDGHDPPAPPSFDYIGVQYQMARLLDPSSGARADDVEHHAHAVASGRPGCAPSIYGACLGWLTAGAAAFVDGRWTDAYAYLDEALSFATRARSRRVLWKAQLGFATVLRRLGHDAAAAVHARTALRILIDSLDTVGAEARPHWAAMIRLPLEHVLRIVGPGDAALETFLGEIYAGASPPWRTRWSERPCSQSRAGEPFSVLHVRRGEDDIFLMG